MSQNLNLEIVTPQRVLLGTEADYVTIPGSAGELGILPGHIPLLTTLFSGVLYLEKNGTHRKIAVHNGYAEIRQNNITVLADAAELSEEIDVQRSIAAQQKAEEELKLVIYDLGKSDLISELQNKIKRCITRQQAAK